MTETLIGAIIMFTGVIIGWVITEATSTGEKGEKGDRGLCLCQCDEEVGMKQGENKYPPAPITDISTTNQWSGYKKGNIDDNKYNPGV